MDQSSELYAEIINPQLIYLNFQPLEVVSHYRDPQLQMAENFSLAPAVTVGEMEGAMDSASVFFYLFFCL